LRTQSVLKNVIQDLRLEYENDYLTEDQISPHLNAGSVLVETPGGTRWVRYVERYVQKPMKFEDTKP